MKNMGYFVRIGALIGIIAGMSGCAWNEEREAREKGRPTTEVAFDNLIDANVASALKTSPVYKFPDVGVKTLNRVVQLNGFVVTDEQKRMAEEIAQQVPGVAQVVNAIVVQPQPIAPTGRTDLPNPNSRP